MYRLHEKAPVVLFFLLYILIYIYVPILGNSSCPCPVLLLEICGAILTSFRIILLSFRVLKQAWSYAAQSTDCRELRRACRPHKMTADEGNVCRGGIATLESFLLSLYSYKHQSCVVGQVHAPLQEVLCPPFLSPPFTEHILTNNKAIIQLSDPISLPV